MAEVSDELQSDAFQRLYPENFYESFISEGVRPDGRPLGRSRPVSVGLGVVSTADSSALVKIGSSAALAGITLETMVPTTEAPDQGQIIVEVELSSLASPDIRPGRPSDKGPELAHRLTDILSRCHVVDLKQLCLSPKQAAWTVYLDVYVLEDNGCLLDVTLLACIAALANLALPEVNVNAVGKVEAVSSSAQQAATKLTLHAWPLSATYGVYKGKIIADPTCDEELLMQSTVSMVMNGADVAALYLQGQALGDGVTTLQHCQQMAAQRWNEVHGIVSQSLAAQP